MSSIIGIACAAGSAAFNGSFAALFKTKKMVDLSVHPMVFQLCVCIGAFLSSWLTAPFLSKNPEIFNDPSVGTEFQFSPFGMVGGFLLVLAPSAGFCAVDDIGVALAQGIWGGGAMAVSCMWGIHFGEVPSKFGLSIAGLLLLIVGVFEVVFCERIGNKIALRSVGEESATLTSQEMDTPGEATTSHRHARGVFHACAVGLSGGSILAPLHCVPPEQQGLVFLPSYGVGAVLLSPAVFFLHTKHTHHVPQLHVREALTAGPLSGLIWNIGNLLSIIAVPVVGYGVAYPIYQCATLFSGAIGVCVFKEMVHVPTTCVFWLGGATLVIGGTLLSAAR